ncbi:MAG: hypothetical protein GXY52_08085 [Chloroflexi bacterium]|nr:hypothetical protein [Chloroflexota bacterium]
MNPQVKSKARVAEHGEVFTAEREVNAMLDLVKLQTERIDSLFLEPACGTGNFLVPILQRKLDVVKKRYGGVRRRADFEFWSVIAVMSVYGVELLEDNAAECRSRLYDTWNTQYSANNKKEATEACRAVVRYVLERNILCGDALSLLDSRGQPLVFSHWGAHLAGRRIKRTDWTLAELLNPPAVTPDPGPQLERAAPAETQLSLFGTPEPADTADDSEGRRVAEFKVVHYLEIIAPEEA